MNAEQNNLEKTPDSGDGGPEKKRYMTTPRRRDGEEYTRPTVDRLEKITDAQIEYTASLMGRRLQKRQIKRIIRDKFNVRGKRVIEYFITAARLLLIERAGRSRQELLGESLELLESIIRDPESDGRTMIAAQKEISEMFGLYMPKRAQLEVKSDVKVDGLNLDFSSMTEEELDKFREMYERITQKPEQSGNS